MASPLLNACQGDYCCAKVNYPPSLQDLESSEHPWMLQARELCTRCNVDGDGKVIDVPLLTPEEMAACLQISSADAPGAMQMESRPGAQYRPPQEKLRSEATFGTPGDVQASWIFEARAYPHLSRWLELEAKWMLDPNDPDQVAEASKHFREDEAASGGLRKFRGDGILQGVRNQLRTVPVCGPCFCIYNSIHAAVVMMTMQRRDHWARREQRLRREREERLKKENLERLLFFERRGDGLGFNVTPKRCSSAGSLGDSGSWGRRTLDFSEFSSPSSFRRPRSAKSELDLRAKSSPL